MTGCLSRLILVIAVLMIGLARIAVGQSGTNAAPAQQHIQSFPTTQGPQLGQLGAFQMFFDDYGARYDGIQLDLSRGETPKYPQSWWISNLVRDTGLSRDEVSLVFAIVVSTHLKVQEHDRETSRYIQQYRDDPNPSTLAQIRQSDATRFDIYRQGFSQIQGDLGEADFAVFSKFIDREYHADSHFRVMNHPPRRDTSQPQ